jgi:hypothetical protein
MKVQNRETKEIVDAVKGEDGKYTVEGNVVEATEMQRKYMKPKEEEPQNDVGGLVVESYSTQSGELNELGKALALCQGEFQAVYKGTAANKYNYADLEAVLAASRDITSKNGLSVVQMNMSKALGNNLLVGVKTMLLHESGQYISGEIYVPAVATKMNTLVQMAGVNISYLRRYGLQSILGLATTDTDGV